jgi:CBS domain-containing protein
MLGIRPTDPVGKLADAAVATVRPTDDLRTAARALAAEDVGLLVVVDAHGVRGVLSERDLVRAVADEADLDLGQERVRDWATDASALVAVTDETPVTDAAATMLSAGLRHLAVVRGKHVVGVVSVRDLLAVCADTEPSTL